jgi:hypothetical protein
MFDMQVKQNISCTLRINILICLCKFKFLFDYRNLIIFLGMTNKKLHKEYLLLILENFKNLIHLFDAAQIFYL